jgi:hypothetical protein
MTAKRAASSAKRSAAPRDAPERAAISRPAPVATTIAVATWASGDPVRSSATSAATIAPSGTTTKASSMSQMQSRTSRRLECTSAPNGGS